QRGMDAADLDVLIAVSPDNFFYLADTLNLSQKIIPDRLSMAVLPRGGEPAIVTCYNEERQIRLESWITDIRTYLEFRETPMQPLADLLKESGLANARIGFEKHFLAACYVEELAALLPNATLVGCDRVFDEAKAIKTPVEIEILTDIARQTEQVILDSFLEARPGDTEKGVADRISLRVFGAGAVSRWLVLAAGSNTAINHPYPGPKALTPGEILRTDVGGNFTGYQSDVARTAAIGRASDEQRSVYSRLREAQREMIESARPGVRACDVYRLSQEALEKRGLSGTSQAIGHSLGVGLHEFPVLHAQEETTLKPGMVLNIEPAVKDSQGFLYHIEDLFLVTEDDPQILTMVMDTEEIFVIR
ncbi:Xaa-Pro peptidase family protein, partial [Chloroflexi bacterium TSY]|nr:Xaa-Pro peptidase family protein [Chloroflexi bacterium TSY]